MTTKHPTLEVKWDAVRLLREYKGLESDVALAQAMGVDRSSISRVTNGKSQPGPRFMAGLCIALGAKLDHIFVVVPGIRVSEERAA